MIYVLVALESELPDQLPANYSLMYTGVGKINATYAACKAVSQADCNAIINYGTAGAFLPDNVGKLLEIGTLYQRDMDARPLATLGETPLENRTSPSEIQLPQGTYSIGSGDSFVTAPPELYSDAVDMEAYAIAKVCQLEGIAFSCFKYITDLADENAAEHWQANVSRGADMFLKKLKRANI